MAGSGQATAGWFVRFRAHRQLKKATRLLPPRVAVVATVYGEPNAQLIAGRLAAAGIKSFVHVEGQPSGQTPIQTAAHVVVRADDERAALAELGLERAQTP